MSPTLYVVTLLLGATAGWNAARLGAGRAGAAERPPGGSAASAGAGRPSPCPAPTPYDWRSDPIIAGCPVCHGQGRFPTFRGRVEHCPCGAQPNGRAAS